MLLTKMLPMIMFFLCLIKLSLSMLLTTMNKMFIIEWDMIMLFSTNIKLDIMLEWSNLMYSSTIMFISSMVMKFSKEYMKMIQMHFDLQYHFNIHYIYKYTSIYPKLNMYMY